MSVAAVLRTMPIGSFLMVALTMCFLASAAKSSVASWSSAENSPYDELAGPSCLSTHLEVRRTAGRFLYTSVADNLTSEQIREAAQRIMQQHDYRSVRRRVLENAPAEDPPESFLGNMLSSIGRGIGDFMQWILTGLFSGRTNRPVQQGSSPPPASAPSAVGGSDMSIAKILLYFGLAILVFTSIWLLAAIIRTSDGRRKGKQPNGFDVDDVISDLSVPPGEQAVSTYESRAIQMADEGEFRAAIRELLIGSMSWIERAGMIRFRRGLTNRDYVRAVWKQEERRAAYLQTAHEFERIYFGRRAATRENFERCLSSFQGSFREETTTTAAR